MFVIYVLLNTRAFESVAPAEGGRIRLYMQISVPFSNENLIFYSVNVLSWVAHLIPCISQIVSAEPMSSKRSWCPLFLSKTSETITEFLFPDHMLIMRPYACWLLLLDQRGGTPIGIQGFSKATLCESQTLLSCSKGSAVSFHSLSHEVCILLDHTHCWTRPLVFHRKYFRKAEKNSITRSESAPRKSFVLRECALWQGKPKEQQYL